MGRASVKLAFHSVWGNRGFVCPALAAGTISQLSPKARQVFSLHLQPPGSLFSSARQSRGSHLTANPAQFLLSIRDLQHPKTSGVPQPHQPCPLTPLSSSAVHSQLPAHPQSLSQAALPQNSWDGCWEKGWRAVGPSALPKIPLQPAGNVLCLERDGFAASLSST